MTSTKSAILLIIGASICQGIRALTEPRRYGNHLSKEDVDALVAPHPESVETLNSWLQHHGIDPEQAIYRSGGGDWITHRVTVAQAEKMLGTKYNVYRRPETGTYIVRTLKYSLPRDLHEHVDVVSPTTYFGKTEAMRVTSFMQPEVTTMEYDLNQFNADANADEIPASCAQQVTPYCLRLLYKTIDYVPGATDRNRLGVTGYLREYASNHDLQVGHNNQPLLAKPDVHCCRNSSRDSGPMRWGLSSTLRLCMMASMTMNGPAQR